MIRRVLCRTILATAVATCTQPVYAQQQRAEQTDFSMETEIVPIAHPVSLPRSALNAMTLDKRVTLCLKENKLDPQQLPANWFIASQVHLDGPHEVDLGR